MSVDNLSIETADATVDATLPTSKDSIMANIVMETVERGIRGKGNEGKKVKFQAISETAPRPDSPVEAAVSLVENEMQKFWEIFVRGFNEAAYEAVADPIAAFIDASWDEDKAKNFRMSVNAMAKFLKQDKEDVATALLSQMKTEVVEATETVTV